MVGTPYANRNASELQDLLGCFVKCALHPQQSLSIGWIGSLCASRQLRMQQKA